MNQTALLMGNESVQLYADIYRKTDAILNRKRRPGRKHGKRKKVSAQIHGVSACNFIIFDENDIVM